MVDDYYPHRSDKLESLSLYDFMIWFDYTKFKPKDATIECYKLKDRNAFLKKRRKPCLLNHYKYKVDINPGKYFHTLLLLFKPWRHLEDLKNGHVTYVESFKHLENSLSVAMKYHEKLAEIQNAFEQAKEPVKKKLMSMKERICKMMMKHH